MRKFVKVSFIIVLLMFLIFPKNIYAGDTTLDTIMSGGDSFLNLGAKNSGLNETELHRMSNLIYNILLGICMVIAVIVGMILGIKYMTATSEDKAAIKETLIPFVIACVIMFSAFTIWKIVIEILT